MSKVYIVGPGLAYAEMFRAEGWQVVDNMYDADLVQFTGGADVSPYLYGERAHPSTGSDQGRDIREIEVYTQAKAWDKRCAGICRGGQFLNVMNGGAMYQHVNNHAIGGTHPALDMQTLTEYNVSSTHHQMMRPHKDALIVGTADHLATFKHREGNNGAVQDDGDEERDIEVLFYETNMTLCFQPHPEFTGYRFVECREWYFRLIKTHLGLAA